MPWVVTLNFSLSNPAPPTMARTAPVPGSTDTTAPVALRGAPVALVRGERARAPVGVPSGAISASTSLRAAVAMRLRLGIEGGVDAQAAAEHAVLPLLARGAQARVVEQRLLHLLDEVVLRLGVHLVDRGGDGATPAM